MTRPTKAIQIFYDYRDKENRVPTKKEFDEWFYGKDRGRASRYYYQVKRQFLKEQEGDD